MSDMIGRIFDRKYRVTRLIGEGGMATVYEAEHTVLKRLVAVKVMHPEVGNMPSATDRFFREAQSASAIGHPNIIEILHVGKEDDGTVYMVEELLKGQSLKQIMEKEKKIPPKTAVIIVLQILSGLKAAHDKGIVHRDIKPDNIFLAKDSRKRTEVKLLDFGVAKVQESAAEMDQTLTQLGTVLGTPKYMSPEQARGADIDRRTDVWSVGAILYEMLCGQPPYSGENYNILLAAILMDKPKPLGEMMPSLSAELIKVVEKAMSKNRDERYQDASEMIEDLIPIGKGVEKLMTASTAKALRNSLIPPSAARGKHSASKEQNSTSSEIAEYEPVKLKSFPPVQQPWQAQPLPPAPPHPSPPPIPIAARAPQHPPAAPPLSAQQLSAKPIAEQPLPVQPVAEQPVPVQPVAEQPFAEQPIELQYLPELSHLSAKKPAKHRGFYAAPEALRATRLSADSKRFGLKWLFGVFVLISALATIIFFLPRKDINADQGDYPAVDEALGFWDSLFSRSLVKQGQTAGRNGLGHRRKTSNTQTASPKEVQNREGSTGDSPTGSAPSQEPVEQPKVKINVNVIPPYAELFLEGKRVGKPIVIPKSNDSMRLDIMATGYIPLNVSIVPNRDQDMELTMKKISVSVQLKRE